MVDFGANTESLDRFRLRYKKNLWIDKFLFDIISTQLSLRWSIKNMRMRNCIFGQKRVAIAMHMTFGYWSRRGSLFVTLAFFYWDLDITSFYPTQLGLHIMQKSQQSVGKNIPAQFWLAFLFTLQVDQTQTIWNQSQTIPRNVLIRWTLILIIMIKNQFESST